MQEKNIYLCRCEEITLQEVEAAIDEGYHTLNEIKRRTRAGMGLCQGKTCSRLISRLLAEKTGLKLSEIVPSTRRPPVRPIKMALFTKQKGRSGKDDQYVED